MPDSAFPPWDGKSVVLYDTQSGMATNFGPGNIASPAFGGDHFVYTSDGEAWVVDLKTMHKQSLGPGYVAYFLGDDNVVVNPGDNSFTVTNLQTLGKAKLSEINDPLLKSMVSQRTGGSFKAKWVDGRYAIRLARDPENACQGKTSDHKLCVAKAGEDWVVDDLQAGRILYSFRADKVETAGPGEIVVATPAVCKAPDGKAIECFDEAARQESATPNPQTPVFVDGTTNIFLVDLATGQADFVATASYSISTNEWPANWPLTADAASVAWTQSYCGQPSGQTRIFDRSTKRVTALNQSLWVTIRSGRLGIGEFGVRALLDPRTLRFTAVLPAGLSDVGWSADLRYAATGASFGHGGLCG